MFAEYLWWKGVNACKKILVNKHVCEIPLKGNEVFASFSKCCHIDAVYLFVGLFGNKESLFSHEMWTSQGRAGVADNIKVPFKCFL